MKANQHPQEETRLAALADYGILDTPSEKDFDEIVRVVAAICGAPVSLVSLVDRDRQWFKAKAGIDLSETPIELSVCAHGILQPDLLEIEDMTKDARTIDNPLVTGAPHARFYAGAALTNENGLPMGMLCVLDYQPRKLNEAQRDLLKVMAKLVMQQIELRRALAQERVLRQEVDHRVKNSLQQVVAFLRLQERRTPDAAAAAMIAEARHRVATVAEVHDHLHRSADAGVVRVDQFLKSLCDAVFENMPTQIDPLVVEVEPVEMRSDRIMALGLITNELLANAVKHAFRDGRRGRIAVGFRREGNEGVLTVSDNGVGLPADFTPTATGGLGLRVVVSLVDQLHGRLVHDSDAGGARFSLYFQLQAP